MNGYIIEAYSNMENAYTCHRLVEEAAVRGISLEIVGIHDMTVGWNEKPDGDIMADPKGLSDEDKIPPIDCNGKQLLPVDFVINRYKWGKCKDQVNKLAARSYNPLPQFNLYVNKYEQLQHIWSSAFCKPRYILSDSFSDYYFLSRKLGSKMVAKGLENSMGREIFLIQNKEDLDALRQYGKDKEWLFEEFIETSFGRDVRVYSIRGEVVGCMQRRSEGDFRANVALGAGVTAYETTNEIRQIAKDIYEQTHLDFVGIDLLFGNNCFYLCEINVMPGLEGIEQATGVNVAGKMMDMICGDFGYDQKRS